MKRFVFILLSLLVALLFVGEKRTLATTTEAIITTIAGTGIHGFSGDGGPAINAAVYQASGIAAKTDGTLFFSDLGNQRLRKIDSQNIINTIAGNGTIGFSGDGEPALNASINYPEGIAIDNLENVYFADVYNHRIRKIDTSGTISTFAGGNPCVVDGIFNPGDDGLATEACLHYPTDVEIDLAGNFLIVDSANNAIRKVDTATGIITLVAGSYYQGFSGDGGPAIQARLNRPWAASIDSFGNIYITDRGNQRIRKIDTNGVITTITGTGEIGFSGDGGPAINAKLNHPVGITANTLGNIYFTDFENYRVRKIDASGIISTVAGGGTSGVGDNGPATQAFINRPHSLVLVGLDKLYITDFLGHRIRLVALQPSTLIEDLVKEVESFNLKQGIENSLDVKLQNVIDSLVAENTGLREDTINKLQAFIQAVEAQRDKELTDLQATTLITAANELIVSLSQ